jgi:hypothetical protein
VARKQLAESVRAARARGIPEAPDSFYQNASYMISFGNRFAKRRAAEPGVSEAETASPPGGEADKSSEE